MPDGTKRIRKDFATMPVYERVVQEMDRIPSILQDPRFGIYANAGHMEKMRSLYINTNNYTLKDLGLTNNSWTGKMSAQLNIIDVPGHNTTAQNLANSMSYLRRVVSPWWIGGSMYVREIRGRDLDMFMLMARDERVTDLLHSVLIRGDIDNSAIRRFWEGDVGKKAIGKASDLWGDNHVNFEIEYNLDLDFLGSNKSKVDSLQNIKMEDKATQEQLDELFPNTNQNLF